MCYLILFSFLIFSGCSSVPLSGYIGKVDHPYDKKFYGTFEKIVATTIYVLKKKGWKIDSEADPSIYERDDRYDNGQYQNLLLMTTFKSHYRFFYSTSAHLNVFIHSIGNTCELEIRYEGQNSMVKQFASSRNDRLVQGIFDAVETEINM